MGKQTGKWKSNGLFVVAALMILAVAVPGWSETIMVTPTLAGQVDGTEHRITSNTADQYDPAISGNIIVYTDLRGSDSDIWYYDLSTWTEHPATTALGNQQLNDVSDGKIVYTDLQTFDIVVFDIASGTTTNLTNAAGSVSTNPAIGGALVAWEDQRDGNKEIYARDLATGEERRVSNSPDQDVRAAVNGGIIVWQRCAIGLCDIYSYDWATGTTRQITNTPPSDERRPDINNGRVVYDALRDGERDICLFDLASGIEKCLSLPGEQTNPSISGDFVSFDDLSAVNYNVRLWHIPTNTVYEVTSDPAGQYLNDIDGRRIVYTNDALGQLDISMFEFNLKPVANAGTNQSVSAGTTVLLNGSASFDANGDPLTFRWSLDSVPAGSSAPLSDPTAVQPTFVAGAVGIYVASLVVNDGFADSPPSNVTVTATSNTAQVTDVLRRAIIVINALDPGVFKNPNMQHALTNKISAVLIDIQNGLYHDALDKLQNDILKKTDGCATGGSPDKNDWITSCPEQSKVYPLIQQAIKLLWGM